MSNQPLSFTPPNTKIFSDIQKIFETDFNIVTGEPNRTFFSGRVTNRTKKFFEEVYGSRVAGYYNDNGGHSIPTFENLVVRNNYYPKNQGLAPIFDGRLVGKNPKIEATLNEAIERCTDLCRVDHPDIQLFFGSDGEDCISQSYHDFKNYFSNSVNDPQEATKVYRDLAKYLVLVQEAKDTADRQGDNDSERAKIFQSTLSDSIQENFGVNVWDCGDRNQFLIKILGFSKETASDFEAWAKKERKEWGWNWTVRLIALFGLLFASVDAMAFHQAHECDSFQQLVVTKPAPLFNTHVGDLELDDQASVGLNLSLHKANDSSLTIGYQCGLAIYPLASEFIKKKSQKVVEEDGFVVGLLDERIPIFAFLDEESNNDQAVLRAMESLGEQSDQYFNPLFWMEELEKTFT